MVVVPDGAPCHCGGRGCVEAHCSRTAMIDDLVQRHGRRAADRLGLSLRPDRVRADYARLCLGARDGDPQARDTVGLACRRIAQAALSAVNLLDVSRIVLGGESLRGIQDPLCAEIDRLVNGQAIARSVRRVAVETSVIGDDAGAVGAASLVLHGNYSPGWRLLLGETGS
jgi:predicted NBD/HSP70 family sugar kinase